jgi:hypothetical protein
MNMMKSCRVWNEHQLITGIAHSNGTLRPQKRLGDEMEILNFVLLTSNFDHDSLHPRVDWPIFFNIKKRN